MKLRIIYDPKNGKVVPDSQMEPYLKAFAQATEDVEVTLGSELMVTWARVFVAEGLYDAEIVFEGEAHQVTKMGCLSDYPLRMDALDRPLSILAGWRKYKQCIG